MTRLLRRGVLLTGPEIVIDEAGRQTRNMAIQPCGCWTGEVYRSATIDGVGHREGWCLDSSACDTHAAVVAVRMLAESERRNGPLPLSPHHRAFLNRAPEIEAAGAALDAELRALTGEAPRGIARQLDAAAALEGQRAIAPTAPAPKTLKKQT